MQKRREGGKQPKPDNLFPRIFLNARTFQSGQRLKQALTNGIPYHWRTLESLFLVLLKASTLYITAKTIYTSSLSLTHTE